MSYHVPQPPHISEEEEEDSEFLARVKNSYSMLTGSLRRSDTSSATLPVTWSNSSIDPSPESSQDSLGLTSSTTNSPPVVQGPVILLGDNFEPQVMTEDYQVCPPPYSSTSASISTSESGSMFYATFIPDSCVLEDQVSIVCNGYTQIETDSHDTSISESEEQQPIVAEVVSKEKAWTSSAKLPTLLDFWERRNSNKECQFKKYASESNISKNQELPENGLRKIPKERNFTSCEESFNEESDYSVRSGYEDHIYQRIDTDSSTKRQVSLGPDESGFFSYENNTASRTPEENEYHESKDSYYEDDLSDPTYACVGVDWSRTSVRASEESSDNNVTVIAVDFNPTNINNNNNNNNRSLDHDKPVLGTSVKDLRKLFERVPEQQVTFNNSTVKPVTSTGNIPSFYSNLCSSPSWPCE